MKFTPHSLVGKPMHGCNSPTQLADILNALSEYPEASADEIAAVTGHPITTVKRVMSK